MRALILGVIAALALTACGQPSGDPSGEAAATAPELVSLPNPLINPGFEEGADGASPPGWYAGVASFPAVQDAAAARTGERGALLRWAGDGAPAPDAFGTLLQEVNAAPYRGLTIRFHASARRLGDPQGRAQLWLRVDGENRIPLVMSNNDPAGAVTSPEWADYTVTVAVPADAQTLVLGIMQFGAGETQFDDFAIEASARIGEGNVPAAPLTADGAENLAAFARLYGYVRFFHPSDEAANADWDELALAGVEHVEGARTNRELAATLLDFFAPLAPSLQILPADAPAPVLAFDPAAPRVAWRRHGFGGGGGSPTYRGERLAPADGLPQMARLPLPGGLVAYVPLQAAVDGEGHTLPRAHAQPVGLSRPEGFIPSSDDRAARLASVVIAWNIFQHFYPYWDVVEADWPAALTAALQKAAEDPDAAAFDATMGRLVAVTRDGHGNAYAAAPVATLPLQWRWIEDALVVTAADSATGLRIGDVVTAVDGQPVAAVMQEWDARAAGATDARRREKALQLLAMGPAGETRTLALERTSGSAQVDLTFSVTTAAQILEEPRPDEVAELEPGILYVDLTRLDDAGYTAALDRIAAADAVIFDMRGYPGFLSVFPATFEFLQRLGHGEMTSARFRVPVFTQPDQAGRVLDGGGWALPAHDAPFPAQRRAFLTDERAISAAETIMGIVEAYDLAEIVGSPTAGTNGDIDATILPTGHRLIWTGLHVLKHDGSPHHGVGVLPTIPVTPTIDGIRSGRDEVLEAALAAVRD